MHIDLELVWNVVVFAVIFLRFSYVEGIVLGVCWFLCTIPVHRFYVSHFCDLRHYLYFCDRQDVFMHLTLRMTACRDEMFLRDSSFRGLGIPECYSYVKEKFYNNIESYISYVESYAGGMDEIHCIIEANRLVWVNEYLLDLLIGMVSGDRGILDLCYCIDRV